MADRPPLERIFAMVVCVIMCIGIFILIMFDKVSFEIGIGVVGAIVLQAIMPSAIPNQVPFSGEPK